MKEYKVLIQKSRFFRGKYNPEKLEKALNSYAKEGWAVVSIVTDNFPSLTSSEMIIVMERNK